MVKRKVGEVPRAKVRRGTAVMLLAALSPFGEPTLQIEFTPTSTTLTEISNAQQITTHIPQSSLEV